MNFITSDIAQNYSQGIFETISIEKVVYVPEKSVPVFNYFITEYPRLETQPFSFVIGYDDMKKPNFSNQYNIIAIAKRMFEGSKNLGPDEHAILMDTFKQGLRTKPTLPGRL